MGFGVRNGVDNYLFMDSLAQLTLISRHMSPSRVHFFNMSFKI